MNNKKPIKIGVSGDRGSFSEEAGLHYCKKHKVKNYKLTYLISVEKVLKNLELNRIDLGIFPIENSISGIVHETIDAMSRHNFKIKNFFKINIKQNIMLLPYITETKIKKVASHPQALKQCRIYLKKKWPDIKLIKWADTAKAAKDLSQGKLSSDTAVIVPYGCAKLYKLKVLGKSIQDSKFNFTAFLVATKI